MLLLFFLLMIVPPRHWMRCAAALAEPRRTWSAIVSILVLIVGFVLQRRGIVPSLNVLHNEPI